MSRLQGGRSGQRSNGKKILRGTETRRVRPARVYEVLLVDRPGMLVKLGQLARSRTKVCE